MTDPLVEEIKVLIRKVFSDKSVPREQTADDLEEIQEEIECLLDVLKSDTPSDIG